jgi:acyl carrier protein
MSQETDVFERVKKVVSEQLTVDAEQIKPDSTFIEDLGADSLDIVELVMAFEEEFDIEIPDEAAEKILSVQDAVNYINEKAVTSA